MPEININEFTDKSAKRDEYVNQLMQENRKITTLSEEQHDAIQFLCSVRHEMHKGQKAFFLSDDPKHKRFELLVGQDGRGTINEVLEKAGLPTVSLDSDIFKVETDKCFKREDYVSDYEFEMAKAGAFDRSAKLADKLNKSIEKYLGDIDRQYGTNYKPHGGWRFHKPTMSKQVHTKYEKKEKRSGQKPRIFVDMDGVLAKFNNMISSPEELYEQGYFLNLEPQQRVVDAVKELIGRGNVEVFIMSAVLADSKYALGEKNEWVDKFLPEIDDTHRIFPPCGDNKLHYIPKGVRATDVLLDDYTKNLKEWEPPAIGVKLLNDINSTKGTWKGNKISFNRPPEEIADLIEKVVVQGSEIKDLSREVGQSKAVLEFSKQLSDNIGEAERLNIHLKGKEFTVSTKELVTIANGITGVNDQMRFKTGTDAMGRGSSSPVSLAEIDFITDKDNRIVYETEEHRIDRIMSSPPMWTGQDNGPDR